MAYLINLNWRTINRIYCSKEIGYYSRMKGRGERVIIANGNLYEGYPLKNIDEE